MAKQILDGNLRSWQLYVAPMDNHDYQDYISIRVVCCKLNDRFYNQNRFSVFKTYELVSGYFISNQCCRQSVMTNFIIKIRFIGI